MTFKIEERHKPNFQICKTDVQRIELYKDAELCMIICKTIVAKEDECK